MFDIDEHPRVDQALQLAASSQISIAVTNPCIELWFLLHFQDQTADLHRHKAQEISSDLLGCAKVPTAAALIELVGCYEDARRRAQALDRKHEMDGSPPRSNPSSSLWCLVDEIGPGHPGGNGETALSWGGLRNGQIVEGSLTRSMRNEEARSAVWRWPSRMRP